MYSECPNCGHKELVKAECSDFTVAVIFEGGAFSVTSKTAPTVQCTSCKRYFLDTDRSDQLKIAVDKMVDDVVGQNHLRISEAMKKEQDSCSHILRANMLPPSNVVGWGHRIEEIDVHFNGQTITVDAQKHADLLDVVPIVNTDSNSQLVTVGLRFIFVVKLHLNAELAALKTTREFYLLKPGKEFFNKNASLEFCKAIRLRSEKSLAYEYAYLFESISDTNSDMESLKYRISQAILESSKENAGGNHEFNSDPDGE